MNVPDMKDDCDVWDWVADHVRTDPPEKSVDALRSLVREVARKVVAEYATRQFGVRVPEDGMTIGIADALDSICGPAPKGE